MCLGSLCSTQAAACHSSDALPRCPQQGERHLFHGIHICDADFAHRPAARDCLRIAVYNSNSPTFSFRMQTHVPFSTSTHKLGTPKDNAGQSLSSVPFFLPPPHTSPSMLEKLPCTSNSPFGLGDDEALAVVIARKVVVLHFELRFFPKRTGHRMPFVLQRWVVAPPVEGNDSVAKGIRVST